jgi:hypothetical protein
MPRRKTEPSEPPPGINYEAILADRSKGVQPSRRVCGCGGRVTCVRMTPLSEAFKCETCKDVVVILLRHKDAEPPRYSTYEPERESRDRTPEMEI